MVSVDRGGGWRGNRSDARSLAPSVYIDDRHWDGIVLELCAYPTGWLADPLIAVVPMHAVPMRQRR